MTEYEDTCLFDDNLDPIAFHTSDPWTSKAAAREVRHAARGLRFRILVELNDVGLAGRTAFELAGTFGVEATTAGTRLGELVAAGHAEPIGHKRNTDTGHGAEVHRITRPGIYLLIARAQDATIARQDRPSGRKPAGRPSHRVPSRYGLSTARDRVLEELVEEWRTAQLAASPPAPAGLTDHEIAARTGILRTAIGTARRKLVDDGLVELVDGVTRPTPAGHRAQVHAVTEAGRRTLRAIARPE